jgi:ribosomal-protein-alanine N-acetyltransferase
MKIFLETDRYLVREMTVQDAEGMFMLDSDEEVHEYLGKKTIKTEEQALESIRKVIEQYGSNGIGRWAIEWKVNGDFVGWTGLKYEHSLWSDERYYDLGYRIRPEYWRKGIAAETAQFSRDYAFNELGVQELFAAAHVDNEGSNHILKKIGFQWEKYFFYEDLKCNWYKIDRSDID